MRMRSSKRRALVAALAVTALTMAGAVAITVDAAPAHAASCSAGYVGLTFDDGPSNAHTPALLNALKQNGLKATLFNEGQFAVAYPAQVQAEVAAGMWIGNHTYDHPHLTTLSQSQIDSEIGQTQTDIANAGGGTPKLFRPPYGETNSTVKAVEAKYGLTEIIWNIDSQDWNGASVAQIVQANSQLTNGQVILMHEWPANTLTAIPQIAQVLASHNLCPGMISPQTGRAVAPSGGGGGGGWQLHRNAVGRLERQRVVQPQCLGHRLHCLDRDGEHGRPRGRPLHLERQCHLPQPVRHESHAQRQRQQLGLHRHDQRPVGLAIGLL